MSENASLPFAQPASWKRPVLIAAAVIGTYLITAYLVLPAFWRHHEHRQPPFGEEPRITHTADGVPGDAVNVALIGTETELKQIMTAAKWSPAAPLSLRSDLAIAFDSIFGRPDTDAPVSSLYLFGRKEDLAFEQPVGNSPRRRHHVRFWRSPKPDAQGRPVWLGSAVYDDHVGINRRTGQITHHTAADIDAERHKLFDDLQQTGDLVTVYFIDGFHTTLRGTNGGGDPWATDGRLQVGVIGLKVP